MARTLAWSTLLLFIFTPVYIVLALQCGDLSYDPASYTCYTSITGNDIVCPIVAGEQLLLCGNGCYSNRTYSCINGIQVPLPPPSGPFVITASRPGAPFDGQQFQAIARHFQLGVNRPYTYCPFARAPCHNTTSTIFRNGELVVRVPGGQQTYIESSGAFAFTSPHSDDHPNFYSLETRAFDGAHGGGFFGPHGGSWLACPIGNATNMWQVFAKLAGVRPDGEVRHPSQVNATTSSVTGRCTEFVALVNRREEAIVDVWQYI